MKILNKMISNIKKNIEMKPNETVNLKDMVHLVYCRELETLYNNENLAVKLTASLLNALLKADLPAFILSKRIMDNIILNDSNLETNTINGTQYKYFLKLLLDSQIIRTEHKSSEFGKAGIKRAGLFVLIDEDFIKYFNKDRTEQILKEYIETNDKRYNSKKTSGQNK